jgi:hypothetical protein
MAISILFNVLSVTSLCIVLICSYIYHINLSAWVGFNLEINYLKLTTGILLINSQLISILLLNKNNIVILYLYILMIFSIMPFNLYGGLNNKAWGEIIFVNGLFLIMTLVTRIIKIKKFNIVNIPRSYMHKILISLSSMTVFLSLAITGANYNLDELYILRSNNASVLPYWFDYIHFTVTKVFLPFSCLYLVTKKNYKQLLYVLLLFILMFGITQHRNPIFVPIIIFACILSYKPKKNNINKLTILFIVLGLISFIDVTVYKQLDVALDLYVRRLFFVPALTNFEYIEFIKQNQFIYWANSKITLGLIDYPYSAPMPYLIGDRIHTSYIGSHSNTGFIGSGFMHLGYYGIVFYGIILALLISFIKSYSKSFIHSLFFLPCFLWAVMSSDLPTVILTHGLIFTIIISVIIENSHEQKNI